MLFAAALAAGPALPAPARAAADVTKEKQELRVAAAELRAFLGPATSRDRGKTIAIWGFLKSQ